MEEGIEQDKLVVIDTQRSCDLIVGILAVLKSGGAFVLSEEAPPGSSREAWLRSAGADLGEQFGRRRNDSHRRSVVPEGSELPLHRSQQIEFLLMLMYNQTMLMVKLM